MRREVLLAAGAEHDLAAIYGYLLQAEGEAAAEHVLERRLQAAEGLAELPERAATIRRS